MGFVKPAEVGVKLNPPAIKKWRESSRNAGYFRPAPRPPQESIQGLKRGWDKKIPNFWSFSMSQKNDTVIPESAPLLVSMREAARLLGLAYPTVRNWQRDGRLPIPTIQLGRRRLVAVQSITDYVNGMLASANIPTPSPAPAPAPTPEPVISQKRGRGRPRRIPGGAQ